MTGLHGWLVVDKPVGPSSAQVVGKLKWALKSGGHGKVKIGHGGTLDPLASGVLPIALGEATKLSGYLLNGPKAYRFTVRFGIATSTDEAAGDTLATSPVRPDATAIQAALPAFTGPIRQRPPAYSALKVDGKKMYDLARAGETIEPRLREISVHELELIEQTAPNRFLLRAVCSRGTYVRSLCESIAEKLGTIGYVPVLLRTRSGPFVSEQALTIAELDAAKSAGTLDQTLTSCEDAMAFLPELRLPADRTIPTKNGLETHVRGEADGLVRVYGDGVFLGIGEIKHERFRLTIHLY